MRTYYTASIKALSRISNSYHIAPLVSSSLNISTYITLLLFLVFLVFRSDFLIQYQIMHTPRFIHKRKGQEK